MGFFDTFYSQKAYLLKRKEQGLHIINELQRFRLLFACLFCCWGTSLMYIFELFTTEYAGRFEFSAGQQSTISTVGVCFCCFVVHYALFYEQAGPTILLYFAALTGFVGTLGLSLVFQDILPGNLITICVFYAILNTCAGILDATAVVTLQHNFPRNRGPVLGLAKVMAGLGSSLFSSVKSNLFTTNMTGYVYFLMAFSIAVPLFSSLVLVLPPYHVNWWRGRKKTPRDVAILKSLTTVYFSKSIPFKRIIPGYITCFTLVVFFAISSPVVAYLSVSQGVRYFLGALTLILVFTYVIIILPFKCLGGVNEPSPSALKAQQGHQDHQENNAAQREEEHGDDKPLQIAAIDGNQSTTTASNPELSSQGTAANNGETDDVPKKKKNTKAQHIIDDDDVEVAETGENGEIIDNPFAEYVEEVEPVYTEPTYPGDIFHVLKHIDVYLLYSGFILLGSMGMIVMYNPSTIYVARTGQQRSEGLSALYTAFLGVGSALGRICVGVYEALVQRQKEGHRRFLVTTILPIPPLIGVIGGILILVLPGGALLLPYILVYFMVGAFYGICAVVIPALFSTHMSIYFTCSTATSVVAVICFNRLLFGYYVDAQHDKLGYHKGEECMQRECIMVPIIVAIVLCAVSTALLTTVHIRYNRYVRRFEREKARSMQLDDLHGNGQEDGDVPAFNEPTQEPSNSGKDFTEPQKLNKKNNLNSKSVPNVAETIREDTNTTADFSPREGREEDPRAFS